MQQASLNRDEVHAQLAEGSRFSGLPAWIGSLLFHMAGIIVIALVVFFRPAPPGQQEVREVSAAIVLKKFDAAGEYYEGENDQPNQAESAPAGAEISQAEALPSEQEFSADLTSALPDADFGRTFGDPGESAGGGNADLSGGGDGGPGARRIEGGKARTGVFGVESEGYSFVYVFDCSASMSAPAGRPLAAAKQQLLASIDSLDKTHQFQIIFYNREPYVLNLTGVEGRLVFGEEKNMQQARKFVAAIDAELNTNHEPALMMALRMRPDVIFFLTDADDPVLTEEQMRRIGRLNAGGSVINTIEFGTGAPPVRPNWLMRLAHEHQGQYQFVNVRQLP